MCNDNLLASGLGKMFMDATISHNMGELSIFVLSRLPYISTIYDDTYSKIGPVVDSAFWSVGYIMTYVINNMYNEYNSEKYCKSPIFGTGQDMFLFMGSVIILILTKYNLKYANMFTTNKSTYARAQYNYNNVAPRVS
jgi:hypothetical protein